MKSYKIIINISEAGGVYSARNMEEAKKIAEVESENIYTRLNGRCSVVIESIEEVSYI